MSRIPFSDVSQSMNNANNIKKGCVGTDDGPALIQLPSQHEQELHQSYLTSPRGIQNTPDYEKTSSQGHDDSGYLSPSGRSSPQQTHGKSARSKYSRTSPYMRLSGQASDGNIRTHFHTGLDGPQTTLFSIEREKSQLLQNCSKG